MSEFIKTVRVDGEVYEVYAINREDYSEGYDVFDERGFCINIGNIFFWEPEKEDIEKVLLDNIS